MLPVEWILRLVNVFHLLLMSFCLIWFNPQYQVNFHFVLYFVNRKCICICRENEYSTVSSDSNPITKCCISYFENVFVFVEKAEAGSSISSDSNPLHQVEGSKQNFTSSPNCVQRLRGDSLCCLNIIFFVLMVTIANNLCKLISATFFWMYLSIFFEDILSRVLMETLNIMTAIKFWLFFMWANKRSKIRFFITVNKERVVHWPN